MHILRTKKDTFLLYIFFADVDHDVRDVQDKNCYKMIYNMSIFEKVDFFVIWPIGHYEKGPGTEFPHIGNMGHFLWGV